MHIDNHIITYRDRPEGSESKLNTVSDGIKVINKMLHLYRDYRPMHFFGIISVLLLIIAAILFVPVISEYISTGMVPRFPTLIVSGFLVISSIMSLFAGLILSTIKNKDRREFEFRLQQISEWQRSRQD